MIQLINMKYSLLNKIIIKIIKNNFQANKMMKKISNPKNYRTLNNFKNNLKAKKILKCSKKIQKILN